MAPLQSNLLSESEKKIAREYLKTEVEKLEENAEVTTSGNINTQHNEGGEDKDDAEELKFMIWRRNVLIVITLFVGIYLRLNQAVRSQ